MAEVTSNMTSMISRLFLVIEVAVLGILLVPLVVITAFGVVSIDDFKGLLFFLAFSLVCIAFVSTAELVFRIIRRGTNFDQPVAIRLRIALGGAVVAAAFTAYGRLFLSTNERWAQGIDFISVGCFVWLPLVHVWILSRVKRASGLTKACLKADGSEGP